MRGEHERPPVTVDCFTAVDIDRTILDSTAFFERGVVPALDDYLRHVLGEGARQFLHELSEQVADTHGQSFDMLQMVDDKLRAAGLAELNPEVLIEEITQRNSDDARISPDFIKAIMAPDSLMLLNQLSENPREAWGFLTTGGRTTQYVKAAIVERIVAQQIGYTPSTRIIATEHKARDMTGWYDVARDDFSIPRDMTGGRQVYAHAVRLIDDKAKNLSNTGAFGEQGRIQVYLARKAGLRSEREALSLAEIMYQIEADE